MGELITAFIVIASGAIVIVCALLGIAISVLVIVFLCALMIDALRS